MQRLLTRKNAGKNLGSSPPKVTGREEARGRPPGRAAPSPHRPSRREPPAPLPAVSMGQSPSHLLSPLSHARASAQCAPDEHLLNTYRTFTDFHRFLPIFQTSLEGPKSSLPEFTRILRGSGENRNRVDEIDN